MPRAPIRARAAPLALLTGALLAMSLALAPAPPAAAGDDRPPGTGSTPGTPGIPGTRPRLVRRFDFEEAERVRVVFPRFFRRIVGADRGFSRFGRLSLTRGQSAGGHWSFRFDLDGGSLAAQVPTGVVPVLPLADYLLTARVRTEGLRQARARMVAWLSDAEGRPIPESRRATPLVQSPGAWQTISLRLDGEAPEAVDMVLELQLLEPRQYLAGTEADERPLLVDVRGSAWFDDVTVWLLPRIEMTTRAAGNVIARPRRPALAMLVRDLADGPLTAHLRVQDLAGTTMHEARFPAPRGRTPLVRELPIDTCGWYRAVLEVARAPGAGNGPDHEDEGKDEGGPVARQTLDFVVVPPPPPDRASRARRLAVSVPYSPLRRLGLLAPLLGNLGAGGAVLGVWHEHMRAALREERGSATRASIEALFEEGIDLTFALESVPAETARRGAVDPREVLELLGGDPAVWRGELDELLINFGLRVPRWQMGGAARPTAYGRADLAARLEGARAALGRLVPALTLVVPLPADRQLPPGLGATAVNVVVPPEVEPEAIAGYAGPWQKDGREVMMTLRPLPAGDWTPRQRMLDLVLRVLHAWRAGTGTIAIDAPWTWGGTDGAHPTPVYATWRGLARALAGRRFLGTLAVADAVECWHLENTLSGEAALVLWRRQRPGQPPQVVPLHLADHPVTLLDQCGNERGVDLEDGRHPIPVGDMPVFVEDVDPALLRFRAALALDPPFLPARRPVHDLQIVLENPYPVGISGTISLTAPEDLELAPRRLEFALAPGETARRPLRVTIRRSAVSGRKRLEIAVKLAADHEHLLHLHRDLDVGWREVELRSSWSFARDARTAATQIVVTTRVTNHGSEPLDLDAFLLAPGIPHARRGIAGLRPGATVVRTFPLPGDPADLGGRRIRTGVSERGGVAQVNQVLTIPRSIAGARAWASRP